MNTDSGICVPFLRALNIDIDETGEIGVLTNERKASDPFVEFVFSGPKCDGIQT